MIDKKPDEDVYSFEKDMRFLDLFQAFSTEIIRLSLITISGIGFFVVVFGKDVTLSSIRTAFRPAAFFLGLTFIFLGIAIAAALGHRFISTDSMVTLLEKLRAKARGDEADARRHHEEMEWRLQISGPLLFIASFTLALGAASLARVFYMVIIGT
jgi:hypothetical protein